MKTRQGSESAFRVPGLSRPKVAIALGGGAARGLAHLGVLRVLEREGFPIDLIVGTSIGALVGGVYAAHGSIEETELAFRSFAESDDFKRSAFDFIREARKERKGLLGRASAIVRRGIFYGYALYKPSFISAESLAHNIHRLLPDIDIAETRIPFACIAADITHAREVILNGGPIRPMVSASCAIPGVLPPVILGDRCFVDGGWVDRVPALPAFRLGADMVVGVDIAHEAGQRIPTRGVDVMVHATSVQGAALKRLQAQYMDFRIVPDVSKIHWADFTAVHRAIDAGAAAAEAAMPELRRLISPSRSLAYMLRGGPARRRARGLYEEIEVLSASNGRLVPEEEPS